jgi:hypothetical protein
LFYYSCREPISNCAKALALPHGSCDNWQINHIAAAQWQDNLYAFSGRGAASRECSPLRTSPTEE